MAVCVVVGEGINVRVGGTKVEVGSREGRIVDVALITGATVWVEAQDARDIKKRKLKIILMQFVETPKGKAIINTS